MKTAYENYKVHCDALFAYKTAVHNLRNDLKLQCHTNDLDAMQAAVTELQAIVTTLKQTRPPG